VTHLGDRVSALLDGQLSVEATERAMVHLARCRGCRDAVELERLTKAQLAYLSGPEPTDALVGRLLAMGGPSGPLPPRPGYVPGSPRPKPVALAGPVPARAPLVRGLVRVPSVRPPAGRPGAGPGRGQVVRGRRARLAGAVLGALGVVGAGVGGLILTAPAVVAGGAGPGTDSLTIQARPSVTTPPVPGRGSRLVPSLALPVPVVYHDGH
jgi:hypothetical protein